jgi:hypothetical protein
MRIPVLAVLVCCAAAADQPRIVGCEEAVRSPKRGLCANKLGAEDFTVLAPGVSWLYNWHFTTDMVPPAELGFAYIPMVWGDFPEAYTGLDQRLAADPKPPVVFAINEPNLKGQAFITPEVCAAAFKRVQGIAAKHGVPVVGPHYALGSSPADSITAMDPLEKKQVTYSWFVPYMKAFGHFLGPAAKGLPTGVHAYKDLGELTWSIQAAYEATGGPVWVSEFARWDADERGQLEFMMQAVDLMERTPHVAGYAWFKERADHGTLALLAKEPGKLTALGRAYVDMPVHDPHLYYLVPGLLQAERYVEAAKEVRLVPAAEGGVLADMIVPMDGWLEYNMAAAKAGPHGLELRLSGNPGTIIATCGGAEVGRIEVADGKGWRTAAGRITLPAGTSTVRLRITGAGARIDSLRWSAP